jgi:hypothetical protein
MGQSTEELSLSICLPGCPWKPTDMAQSSRHLKVQHSEVVASFDHVVSEPQQIG